MKEDINPSLTNDILSFLFLSYRKNTEDYQWQIYSEKALWTNNSLLSHEIICQTANKFETSFFDETYNIAYIKYNEETIPAYKITLPVGITINENNFFINLW